MFTACYRPLDKYRFAYSVNLFRQLDGGEFKSLIESKGQRDRISSYRLESIRLLGWVSNLVFIPELEQRPGVQPSRERKKSSLPEPAATSVSYRPLFR